MRRDVSGFEQYVRANTPATVTRPADAAVIILEYADGRKSYALHLEESAAVELLGFILDVSEESLPSLRSRLLTLEIPRSVRKLAGELSRAIAAEVSQ